MEIPTGYAQMNWYFTGQNVPNGAQVTLGLDVGGYAAGPNDLAFLGATSWVTNVIPQQTAQITLVGTTVKYGPSATGPTGLASASAAGDIAGESEPPQVAFLIRKITALGGRAGRGRMYVPGLAGGLFDSGGEATTVNANAIADALQAVHDDFVAANVTPVLLHSAGSPVTTPTPITGYQAVTLAATQRRRLRG